MIEPVWHRHGTVLRLEPTHSQNCTRHHSTFSVFFTTQLTSLRKLKVNVRAIAVRATNTGRRKWRIATNSSCRRNTALPSSLANIDCAGLGLQGKDGIAVGTCRLCGISPTLFDFAGYTATD